MDLDKIDLLLEEGLDIQNRISYISDNYDAEDEDGISSRSTEKLFKHLQILQSISKDPITIILNTSGGDTHQGMAMYDLIKNSPCFITIKVIGSAHSMGAVILQAADERVMTKNSTLMVHSGQTVIDAESDNFKRWQKEYERLDKAIEDVFSKRLRGKVTKKELREMLRFDTILDANKALKLGFVDKIE